MMGDKLSRRQRILLWLLIAFFAFALTGYLAYVGVPMLMKWFVAAGFLALAFKLGEEAGGK